MTPTPEEIELARRAADKHAPVGGGHGLAGLCEKACFDAALTAVMEAREKAASFLEGKAARNEETAVWTESLSVRKNSKRDALIRISDAQAIRNGEHLR